MKISELNFFHLLPCFLFAILVSISLPAKAETVEPLLDRLRSIQANENASAVELKSATIIMDRIVQSFPATEAAVSILLEEPYDGIDFTSFATRLEASLNAPATQPAAATQPAPAALPAPLPVTPQQPAVDTAVHTACISFSTAPQSGAAMQLQISLDENGALTGLPELLAPQPTSSQLRKDFLGLALAIENCAPFYNWPKPAVHVMDVSATGNLLVSTLPQTAPALPVFSGLATAPQDLPNFGITSADTEAVLGLDRPAVRDIQARLTVLGYDPRGVDGSLGPGARSAISAWQSSIGVEPSGFLNQPQLDNLKTVSQDQLSTWLLDANNAAIYNPPAKKKRKKRRVRVCKQNALGIRYDCKIRWR